MTAEEKKKDRYSIEMDGDYAVKSALVETISKGYIVNKIKVDGSRTRNDFKIVGKFKEDGSEVRFAKPVSVYICTLSKIDGKQVLTGYSKNFEKDIIYDITICTVAKEPKKIQYFILNEDEMYNEQIIKRNDGDLGGRDNLTLEQLKPYKNAWNKIK